MNINLSIQRESKYFLELYGVFLSMLYALILLEIETTSCQEFQKYFRTVISIIVTIAKVLGHSQLPTASLCEEAKGA